MSEGIAKKQTESSSENPLGWKQLVIWRSFSSLWLCMVAGTHPLFTQQNLWYPSCNSHSCEWNRTPGQQPSSARRHSAGEYLQEWVGVWHDKLHQGKSRELKALFILFNTAHGYFNPSFQHFCTAILQAWQTEDDLHFPWCPVEQCRYWTFWLFVT